MKMADANQPLGGTAIKPVRYHMVYINKIYIGKSYRLSTLTRISGWLGPDWMGGVQVHALRPGQRNHSHQVPPTQLQIKCKCCRTPLSWLKITIFYLIYYSLLACFWIACLVIFFQVYNAVLILLQNYSLNFEKVEIFCNSAQN